MKYSSSVDRYIRRFLTAHRNPDTGVSDELQFDVVTELWFEDEAAFRGTVKYLETSIMPDEVVADEKKLFDRSTMRMATVVERETAIIKK
jgi:hypothetical protein